MRVQWRVGPRVFTQLAVGSPAYQHQPSTAVSVLLCSAVERRPCGPGGGWRVGSRQYGTLTWAAKVNFNLESDPFSALSTQHQPQPPNVFSPLSKPRPLLTIKGQRKDLTYSRQLINCASRLRFHGLLLRQLRALLVHASLGENHHHLHRRRRAQCLSALPTLAWLRIDTKEPTTVNSPYLCMPK